MVCDKQRQKSAVLSLSISLFTFSTRVFIFPTSNLLAIRSSESSAFGKSFTLLIESYGSGVTTLKAGWFSIEESEEMSRLYLSWLSNGSSNKVFWNSDNILISSCSFCSSSIFLRIAAPNTPSHSAVGLHEPFSGKVLMHKWSIIKGPSLFKVKSLNQGGTGTVRLLRLKDTTFITVKIKYWFD